VTAPLSLAEWFTNYYDAALKTYGPRAKDPGTRGKMIQGVCHAGQVMYMFVRSPLRLGLSLSLKLIYSPAGWWHIVVNLESCVAVTQNFVSEAEVRDSCSSIICLQSLTFDDDLGSCQPS